tara:strand:- start:75 stop:491 length:417 start_codon:yes stop_codon:yes gene_type:complete
MRYISIIIFLVLASPVLSYDRPNSKEVKKLFFISPINGSYVTSPVTIKFGIKGMDIVPAGVDKPMSGHHHLLINLDKLPDMNLPIPADKNHLHFGKGQTETIIELPKGKHSLQLLLGNYIHVPHKVPFLSEKIEIIVE